MSKFDYCVFIGRFQPFHNAHLQIVTNALEEEADDLILVIGSYRASLTLKNPWSYQDRKEMILEALPAEYRDRVTVVPARDYLYSDVTWLTGIQNAIHQVVGPDASVKIIGHFKDGSSYYLKLFPQWVLVSQPNFFSANSTDVRNKLFDGNLDKVDIIPDSITAYLDTYQKTDTFKVLQQEHNFLKNYKSKWDSAPFPPVFVTTDAVVVQAGHVLVIRRGRNPGKGMYALPGGFISQHEKVLDSALRELKEETNILFPKDMLRACLKSSKVFDHPSRDTRGRTITHGFFFRIDKLGPLPVVRGGDDASEAMWMSLSDVALHEDNFYSDHVHIINYFVSGVGQ